MSRILMKNYNLMSDDYNRNVLYNYIFKVLTIVFGLINTKLVVGYLGATLYGLWVTITSVISWMSSGDLGIGNGLRNELAKACGECDKEKQKKLVNVAFSTMITISFIVLLIIIIVSEIFFKIEILSAKVRTPMYITACFFCLNLVLGVSQSVAYGYQLSWLTTLTLAEIQLLSILSVVTLNIIGISPELSRFAIIYGISTTIPNILLIIILRTKNIQVIQLKTRIDNKIKKLIMNTGLQFFGIQFCGVILYSTDDLIINKLINSEMVTKYDLITKIYNTGTNLFSILLIALWSAVTYNLAQNNIKWIKEKINSLLKMWGLFTVGVVIVSICFNDIVGIWLGNEAIVYEKSLITIFAVYCSMTAFSAIFVNVLNGMGVIKLQLVLAVISAAINIPLSYVFVAICNMGIFGVKFATFISAFVTALVMPIQAFIELRKLSIGTRAKEHGRA